MSKRKRGSRPTRPLKPVREQMKKARLEQGLVPEKDFSSEIRVQSTQIAEVDQRSADNPQPSSSTERHREVNCVDTQGQPTQIVEGQGGPTSAELDDANEVFGDLASEIWNSLSSPEQEDENEFYLQQLLISDDINDPIGVSPSIQLIDNVPAPTILSPTIQNTEEANEEDERPLDRNSSPIAQIQPPTLAPVRAPVLAPVLAPVFAPTQLPTLALAQAGALQPYGDYCLVICRLSSEKKIPDPTGKMSLRERVDAHNNRRRDEGLELARRLKINCPEPTSFQEITSLCVVRHSNDSTDWFKSVNASSAFVNNIRDYFHRPEIFNRKITVLIRGVDGIHTDAESFKSFLKMIAAYHDKVQLIFQLTKICPIIAPMRYRNFEGLGGTVDFWAHDFLSHLEGWEDIPEVQRIVDIWGIIRRSKASGNGVQDRNTLLPADIKAPPIALKLRGPVNRLGRLGA
ncbi:hypothetical protein GQ44DRAFT_770182 [Phaeosphaeriaceae sp. PMI808]|nr:hypothetical protein GQ44DRAFT_770182 [Phaeosphaeriaceae sp. PMI808]